jgi:hypothetical protein
MEWSGLTLGTIGGISIELDMRKSLARYPLLKTSIYQIRIQQLK